MLGGGNFTVQNKILPGTYINFVSAKSTKTNVGERGIVALGLELDWGKENEIIEVTAEKFIKSSLNVFGYGYTDAKLKGLRDLFKNATKGYFYRLNSGGEKANNDFAIAKYSGTRGNDIKIIIEKDVDDDTKFNVVTLLDNNRMDEQIVKTASELVDNDYVAFKKDASLAITAGVSLEGGTNGTITGQSHQDFLNKAESYNFNALGCLSNEREIASLYVAYTKRLRDEQGVKFQTVLYRNDADYEGVINLKNNTIENDTGLIYWVLGAAGGCAINSSNTNKVYDGEYEINTNYTQSELRECIKNGELVLHQVGDEVRILTDINSLVTTTDEKKEDFKSNQTIRVLDQVAMDIASIFNNRYLGKIPNNDSGRVSLWNDIVTIYNEYATMQAIENFDSKEITVEAGNDIKKSVVINTKIQPINAMERLYVSIVVN